MAELAFEAVRKSFGAVEVIKGIDLQIRDREFVVFVGPSGCGKSTLLRMIAGLEAISSGCIKIDGAVVNDLAPVERGIAMVFQSYALYPHMNVYKNMAFGLKFAKTDKAEVDRRVRQAAEILKLTPLLHRKPRELSGGQRQRVAIGRAIVREPRIFLFDEPLSNLDAELRVQMRVEINKLHRRLGATMIFVTHDQVEAMTLADRIVVLRAGIIEQVGSPLDLYNHPANLFVAGFIGSPRMNFLAAEAEAGDNGQRKIKGKSGFSLAVPAAADLKPGKVTFGVRPENLSLVDPVGALVTGEVQIAEHLGGETFVYVALPSAETVTVEIRGQAAVQPGERVGINVVAGAYHVFDSDGRAVALPRN